MILSKDGNCKIKKGNKHLLTKRHDILTKTSMLGCKSSDTPIEIGKRFENMEK